MLSGNQRTLTIAAATVLLGTIVFASWTGAAAESAPDPFLFGMEMGSIQAQMNAGVKPDYASMWIGPWTLKYGWGGPDASLAAAKSAGVTPVIQFYYWGDDISQSCIENGCYSSLHGANKNKQDWQRLAVELADHLDLKLAGAPAVIILETEFNKGNVVTWEPLDAYLEEKAKFFHAEYPAATVVLGFGNWGRDQWVTWDRAAVASDMTGVQGMRGSTRHALTEYQNLWTETVAGAKRLKELFGKPVLVTDIALSSYPEPEYLKHQAGMIREGFTRLGELKAANVRGILYRGLFDSPNMDTRNYFGEAERHFGLVWAGNQTHKPAMKEWIAGVTAQRTPPPPPTTTTTTTPKPTTSIVAPQPVVLIEAEDFSKKTAGGLQTDAGASAGERWNLWSNGYISKTIKLPANGRYEFRIRAAGTSLGGVAPHMTLDVDEHIVGAADPSTIAWRDYNVQVSSTAGYHIVRIHFTNDAMSSQEDRNLLLDRLEVYRVG